MPVFVCLFVFYLYPLPIFLYSVIRAYCHYIAIRVTQTLMATWGQQKHAMFTLSRHKASVPKLVAQFAC